MTMATLPNSRNGGLLSDHQLSNGSKDEEKPVYPTRRQEQLCVDAAWDQLGRELVSSSAAEVQVMHSARYHLELILPSYLIPSYIQHHPIVMQVAQTFDCF